MGRFALILLLAFSASAAERTDWRNQGVIYLDNSPHAALHPVPVRAVKLHDGFWAPRQQVNIEKSIPTMLELLEEHGAVNNFRRLTGKSNAPRLGPVYTDSDVYKWIEAAAFVLQGGDHPDLRAKVDALIDVIVAAQEPSGYLNTYYVDAHKAERFSEMYRSHELYNLGHLLQGAIAYYRATGDRKLLSAGIRYVDYLVRDFGPGKRPLLTGHPEFEMAVIELYRIEGNPQYLQLAGYLLSGVETERLKLRPSQTKYMFSGTPFTSRKEFEGHAVRAMYAASGATDYYDETGAPEYRKTLDRLWNDLTMRKMYITGGVGSRSEGEAFGDAYELPNEAAYTESCAAIGNMMWNYRMLQTKPDAGYADVIERALYNGINSGMSLSGTMYCYRNPLASTGEKIRNPWYDTTCCPPNLERILASLPGYFYSTSKDGLYVHLYDNSTLNWRLEDGTPVRVEQATKYPWDGKVTLTVTPETQHKFTLYLRIPSWSRQAKLTVAGESSTVDGGQYADLTSNWKPGQVVELEFDMSPRWMTANPRVPEDYAKVAVQKGPIIYCLEQQDQGDHSVFDLAATPSGGFKEEFRPGLLGGVMTLEHAGTAAAQPATDQPLYQTLTAAEAGKRVPATLHFIPYYAWANREPSQMTVWVPIAGVY